MAKSLVNAYFLRRAHNKVIGRKFRSTGSRKELVSSGRIAKGNEYLEWYTAFGHLKVGCMGEKMG